MSAGKRRLSIIAHHLGQNTSRSLSSKGSNEALKPISTATTNLKNGDDAKTEVFRKRSDYKYFLPIQTRFGDNDMYGHLNNAAYYYYFDSIINKYLIEHCGLDTSSSNTTKPIGLVVASQANFYASASYPHLIHAGLRVTKIGKSSVTYRVGIFEEDNSLACVVGGYTHVFVDANTRRPVQALPKEFMDGFEKLTVLAELYLIEETSLRNKAPSSELVYGTKETLVKLIGCGAILWLTDPT